jgi:natural product precursor
MKKSLEKKTKKLMLNRETLANLEHKNLDKVAGGLHYASQPAETSCWDGCV